MKSMYTQSFLAVALIVLWLNGIASNHHEGKKKRLKLEASLQIDPKTIEWRVSNWEPTLTWEAPKQWKHLDDKITYRVDICTYQSSQCGKGSIWDNVDCYFEDGKYRQFTDKTSCRMNSVDLALTLTYTARVTARVKSKSIKSTFEYKSRGGNPVTLFTGNYTEPNVTISNIGNTVYVSQTLPFYAPNSNTSKQVQLNTIREMKQETVMLTYFAQLLPLQKGMNCTTQQNLTDSKSNRKEPVLEFNKTTPGDYCVYAWYNIGNQRSYVKVEAYSHPSVVNPLLVALFPALLVSLLATVVIYFGIKNVKKSCQYVKKPPREFINERLTGDPAASAGCVPSAIEHVDLLKLDLERGDIIGDGINQSTSGRCDSIIEHENDKETLTTCKEMKHLPSRDPSIATGVYASHSSSASQDNDDVDIVDDEKSHNSIDVVDDGCNSEVVMDQNSSCRSDFNTSHVQENETVSSAEMMPFAESLQSSDSSCVTGGIMQW